VHEDGLELALEVVSHPAEESEAVMTKNGNTRRSELSEL
jgi:hypothetical protein